MILLRARVVEDDAVLFIGLIAGGAIQKAPAFERGLEGVRNVAEHFIQPAVSIPGSAGEIGFQHFQQRLRPDASLLGRALAADLVTHIGEQFQCWRIPTKHDQIAGRVAEVEVSLAQPHRVNVRPDEILVGHVEARGLHLTGDHQLGMLEKVLVVRTAEGAVGEDQRGLAAATGATAALRIVGGRGRDVAQVDGIQILDVNAQLHGGRAEQDGKLGGAKILLALHAQIGGDLGGVFAGRNAPEFLDARAEQFDKEFIGRAARRGGRGHTDAIVIRLGAIADAPDERTGIDAIAGNGSAFVFLHAFTNDVSLTQSLKQGGDDLARGRHIGLGLTGESIGRAEEQAETAERGNEGGIERFIHVTLGTRERNLALIQFFDGVKCPRVAEFVVAAPLDAILLVELQIIDLDAKIAPDEIQQGAADYFTGLGAGVAEHGMKRLPNVIGGSQGVEFRVINFDETALLQIRGADSPAAPQVAIHAVADHIAKRGGHFFTAKPDGGVFGVILEFHRKLGGDFLTDGVIAQPLGTGGSRRLINGPA